MQAKEVANFFDLDLVNWMEELLEGKNTLINVSKEKLEQVYAFAYLSYQNKQYPIAGYCFRLLIIANPHDKKYWNGLAASLQMQKCYEEALNCYLSVQMLDQHIIDPTLYVHVADCYFALDKEKEGLHALSIAYKEAKKKKNLKVMQHVTLVREIRSKNR